MNQLLTNNMEGYDVVEPQLSLQSNDMFRIMSVFGVAEDEVVNIISPATPAKIMKYNPGRTDQQVYVATLRYKGISHSEHAVTFTICQKYADMNTAAMDYLYCDGIAINISGDSVTVAGDTITIDGETYFRIAKMISNRQDIQDTTIEAHIYSDRGDGCVIEYVLDWSGMAKSTPVPQSAYRDINARVKSGEQRDSYSLWKMMYPTGIDISYASHTNTTHINIDTGMICTSTLSKHAPIYIGINVVGVNGTRYRLNIYMNIRDMPLALMPQYQMHPGQYLYNKTAHIVTTSAYVNEGATNILMIDGNAAGEFSEGDTITIIKTENTYVREVVSSSFAPKVTPPPEGFTSIVISEEIPKETGYTIITEYDYIDGRQFGSGAHKDYRTPMSARMYILRSSITLNNIFASEIDEKMSIEELWYTFANEVYDGVLGTYALANYDVVKDDISYKETGDIENDSIAGMRYIGHYGRNSLYNHALGDNIPIGIEVPNVANKSTVVISATEDVPYPIEASEGKISIDIEKVIGGRHEEVLQEIVSGYYYKRMYIPIRQSVSNIMLSKIYVIAGYLEQSHSIIAYRGDRGYNVKSILPDIVGVCGELIGYGDTSITMSSPASADMSSVNIVIDDEIMIANITQGSPVIEIRERGAFGTSISMHEAESDIHIIDSQFYNGYIGVISSLSGSPVNTMALAAPAPDGTPNAGYLLIGTEIIEYDNIDGVNISIPDNGRGKYGTDITTLTRGMHVHYISYFTIDDIRPNIKRVCEYNDRYTPRLSLPMNYDNDPVRHGAKAIYLLEIRYETGQKN